MQLYPQHIERAAKARIQAIVANKPAEARSQTSLEFKAWCRKHISLRERPWSLEGHEYLEEIYRSEIESPYVVYEKAAQMGVSTAVLLGCIYKCEEWAAKALYYLSTDGDAYDFSNDRINLAIDESPHLQDLIHERERGRDNVGLRHLGRGTLFCRGMYTRRKVKAVDADIVILDEMDEADQENKQFALDRLLHSTIQHVRELSQPSIPDYGIDETFSRSDQRYWHLKCPACGKYTCLELHLEERDKRPVPMAFRPVPENATWAKPDQRYYRACLHCEAPLDMSMGEWVVKHPSQKTIRGYHLSQLYNQIPAPGYADPADKVMDQILGARKTRERMRVMISVIGFPYSGDRQPVTDAVLDDAEGDLGFLAGARESYMGIDQGDLLHIVIGTPVGERMRVIHLEITDDWDRPVELMRRFGCRVVVGDALPNKNDMKGVVAAANRMRVLGRSSKGYIQYFKDAFKIDKEGEGFKEVPKINVDRTETLDETTKALQDGDILLPKMEMLGGEDLRTYEIFRAQCRMLVKDLEEGANGVMRWVYKRNVPNHFGMALNSMRIAQELAPYSVSRALEETEVLTGEEIETLMGGLMSMDF